MKTEIQSLLEAGTAVIADVFDTMEQTPLVLDNDLFSITGSGSRFVGPAYTITGKMSPWSGGGDRAKLEAIDRMPPGVVAVWAGNDIQGVCCFGDLLATAMKARGCAGVVVDGGIRDLNYLRSLGLPILTRYRTPAQAIGRWRVAGSQIPVQVRGALEEWITVNPGDIVVGDDDGVIIVPEAMASEIAGHAMKWTETESRSRQAIKNGMPLVTALNKYGHL